MAENKKLYQLSYPGYVSKSEEIVSLAIAIFEEIGVVPSYITLPTGEHVPWDTLAAYQFHTGKLSEKNFIEECKTFSEKQAVH